MSSKSAGNGGGHAQVTRFESGPARLPDRQGVAVRDGVPLAWSSYGTGPTTIVLMPTWSIVNSRAWKAQVPYLAQRWRVVTFDGRGCGRSGRPVEASAYTDEQYAADTIAVLDDVGVDAAVLVGWSCGVTWALHVAATHPERVQGIFAIGAACGFPIINPARDQWAWSEPHGQYRDWGMYNKHYWLSGGYDNFVRFFMEQMFPEPHSSKQSEDALAWALDVAPETLAATTAGRLGCDGATCVDIEPLCARVTCPVFVMHGTDDRIRPHAIGNRLAELTGGSIMLVEGGGHALPARDPVLVNREIRAFVEQVAPTPAARTWSRVPNRVKRALYLSSPIGLGHARRDVAIADELRALHPDLQIDWLAQDPVTRVLDDHKESVHPASALLANESQHIEDECGEHDLHAFQALRRMDEILIANFMVFHDVIEQGHYDLVIADEAWDVDHFLHEHPELKRCAYAWFTDFVGWLPMPVGGDHEATLTADYNAEMLEQRARLRALRDRSIFVGDPDDIVTDTFGPGLPSIREWTTANFDFAGYVTGYDPTALVDREQLRRRLGYRPDERVCVVSVGGSGVGLPLLRRVADAVPIVRRSAPDLRFVVVTGPRIDPAALPRRRGLTPRGYLPDLHEHLAACDVAVVQGGLTTCMELTAARRPFVYVPLRNHFEQQFHVRHRLERYGAGTCLDYANAADPDQLAAAILLELDRTTEPLAVRGDGAARAARLLADLI
jgi:pimeloyl-ACP methyl ester carboxylesterase/predicted glycosyltransferase